jgi:xanthine dehydrogenase small subunit
MNFSEKDSSQAINKSNFVYLLRLIYSQYLSFRRLWGLIALLDNSRRFVHFFLNGREQKIEGGEVFLTLSDFLRQKANFPGTKVVCAEGDCGACTVLIARPELSGDSQAHAQKEAKGATSVDWQLNYLPVNSCIQYLFQLDGAHVISVEGLRVDTELTKVQQALVDKNGTQCGFCTPGFVMTLTALAEKRRLCNVGNATGVSLTKSEGASDLGELKDALTGNLCRCTGYEGILEAGLCSVFANCDQSAGLEVLFPPAAIVSALKASRGLSVLLADAKRRVFLPATVQEALEFLERETIGNETRVAIVSGGTDVCVNMNKRGYQPSVIMSLALLGQKAAIEPDNAAFSRPAKAEKENVSVVSETETDADVDLTLRQIELALHGDRRYLKVGSLVTLGQLEPIFKELLPQFYDILWLFGSPQIRSVATLAGNIANGSPIGDSLPFLCVIDAALELASLAADGTRQTRQVLVSEFYRGYKQLDLRPNELIMRVILPLPGEGQIIRLYKISKRQHLDISAFAAAISISLSGHEDGSKQVVEAAIALGGVASTVLRMREIEAELVGKPHALETYEKLGISVAGKLKPLSDVRGSRVYRLNLARNIFTKFYYDCDSCLEA